MCQMKRGAEDKGELLILECWVCFGACPLKLVHKSGASNFTIHFARRNGKRPKCRNRKWNVNEKWKRKWNGSHDTHAYAVCGAQTNDHSRQRMKCREIGRQSVFEKCENIFLCPHFTADPHEQAKRNKSIQIDIGPERGFRLIYSLSTSFDFALIWCWIALAKIKSKMKQKWYRGTPNDGTDAIAIH